MICSLTNYRMVFKICISVNGSGRRSRSVFGSMWIIILPSSSLPAIGPFVHYHSRPLVTSGGWGLAICWARKSGYLPALKLLPTGDNSCNCVSQLGLRQPPLISHSARGWVLAVWCWGAGWCASLVRGCPLSASSPGTETTSCFFPSNGISRIDEGSGLVTQELPQDSMSQTLTMEFRIQKGRLGQQNSP